jgi:formylglycine-generating enzyme required for sulfatase activity/predicted Ser/Thr protein kinase
MDPNLPPTQALPAATQLEEFVVERVLGSGGFGITYLARDTRLDRHVVIKENLPMQFCFRDTHSLTVAPRHTHGEDAENFKWSLENFSKEAAMLASLDHPGIVKVLRSFDAFGTAYFVMPFVDGMALDELAKEQEEEHFSEKELSDLLGRVLGALGYLHDRGIYHRDIKPGNILITGDGSPVLIDFGSARQRLSERSMTVIESPGYTPFEQLQSRGNVGPWSDLYALGGTLVKVMTGETPPKAMDRMRKDPYQPLTARANFDNRFGSVFLHTIDKALAVDEEDRWQAAGEWLATVLAPTAQTAALPSSRVAPVIRQGPVASSAGSDSFEPEPQAGEEREFDLVEGCKIRMCWIPPGEFLMGSPECEWGRRKDETQYKVVLTRGFWMAKTEVTQAQWQAVMGSNPSSFKGCNLPVAKVSWNDAQEFLKKLIGRFGSADGGKMVLPTEAQWEYAARAGERGPYSGGLIDQVAWYGGNSRSPHSVGTKKPNAWGLHDMHGNVWEWCVDWYDETLPGGVDPKGPALGSYRVLRGGSCSWFNGAYYCRAAYRNYSAPTNANDYIGFRLTRISIP